MATLFSKGTGNFTTAGTWGVVDATMFNASETTTTALTTSFVGATTYTPGAITITHIGVKLSVRTGTTGTISVRLAQGGVAVAGTTVTINVADLPVAANTDLNGGWIFFKLSASKLLTAATAYSVQATTSNASQVSLRSTATSNWAVALVTTTTAAPAAGDNLIIGGEYISAGSSNSFTVTMDNTATTDFGSTPTAANSLLTPGIAIGSKGTLTWGTSAATAYYMRMSNSIIVYTGGTLNMGTSGTPCPRDSTMTLFFDCNTTVDYGLVVRNLGILNVYGQSRTSGKDIYYCKLNANQSANSSTLTVDTDTGWLDNDEIGIASTTQAASESEFARLNGNATSTVLTVDGGIGTGGSVGAARSGTSPTQAEIILLTRNVLITGQSSFYYYIQCNATSTVTIRWAQFYWIGSSTANKEGIYIATTTGTFDCQYCSVYRSAYYCWYVASTNATSITISNNVTFQSTRQCLLVNTGTSTVTAANNMFIYTNGSANATISISSDNVFLTNTTVAGSTYSGGTVAFSSKINWNGGQIHSNLGCGFELSANSLSGSIVSTSIWRNIAGNGLSGGIYMAIQPGPSGIYIGNCKLFGNQTANIGSLYAISNLVLDNIESNGDSSFSTTYGYWAWVGMNSLSIINSNFSSASGIRTVHTNDIFTNTTAMPQIICQNTKFAGTSVFPSLLPTLAAAYISSQKHNGVVNSHVLYKKYGTIRIASGTVHSGSTSLQLQPNSASNKLESAGIYGGFKVPISSGQYCSPLVYVYEDGTYNGNRARLIVKRNGALGIDETILMTATAGSDLAWQGLSGSTPVVNDTGVLEFIVDCDGTAGNLYVDTFSATLT